VGRLGGPLGASAAWAVTCMVKRGVFGFGFVAGFKWGFPSCLRGPLGLSPTHWVPWLIHKAKTGEPKTVLQQHQTGLTGGSDRSDRYVPV
jgi:hypothetical protein